MSFADSFKKAIFNINEKNFESYALELFSYQFKHCLPYQHYCDLLGKTPQNIKTLRQIPFLPIECFKNHAVKSEKWKEEKIFMSSGTTQTGRSRHYIKDLFFYQKVAKNAFSSHYKDLEEYRILALLPSYLEQGDSSLIAMIDDFMQHSAKGSGYYLNNYDELVEALETKDPTLLIGVSYALLDLAEQYPSQLSNTIIMETGGMKGRRKEIIRDEFHLILKKAFQQDSIHSEYGMTELMSQAYGRNGYFKFPGWAHVYIRDINDPFSYLMDGKTGGINIIDLANVDSCAFIETKDLGKKHQDFFEILGRFDNSDIRGCNLMF